MQNNGNCNQDTDGNKVSPESIETAAQIIFHSKNGFKPKFTVGDPGLFIRIIKEDR